MQVSIKLVIWMATFFPLSFYSLIFSTCFKFELWPLNSNLWLLKRSLISTLWDTLYLIRYQLLLKARLMQFKSLVLSHLTFSVLFFQNLNISAMQQIDQTYILERNPTCDKKLLLNFLSNQKNIGDINRIVLKITKKISGKNHYCIKKTGRARLLLFPDEELKCSSSWKFFPRVIFLCQISGSPDSRLPHFLTKTSRYLKSSCFMQ